MTLTEKSTAKLINGFVINATGDASGVQKLSYGKKLYIIKFGLMYIRRRFAYCTVASHPLITDLARFPTRKSKGNK